MRACVRASESVPESACTNSVRLIQSVIVGKGARNLRGVGFENASGIGLNTSFFFFFFSSNCKNIEHTLHTA